MDAKTYKNTQIIYQGLRNFDESIVVECSSSSQCFDLVELTLLNNYDLFQIIYDDVGQVESSKGVTIYHPRYVMNKDEYISTLIKVETKLHDIAEAFQNDKDDFHKEKHIHDWILGHIKFTNKELNCRNILGPLFEGKGVCVGISLLAMALLHHLNIEALCVRGFCSIDDYKDGCRGHVWNVVKINSNWFVLDVSADLTWTGQFYRYDWMNLAYDDCLETRVPKDSYKELMDKCVTHYNYFHWIRNYFKTKTRAFSTIDYLVSKEIKAPLIYFQIDKKGKVDVYDVVNYIKSKKNVKEVQSEIYSKNKIGYCRVKYN